MAADLPESRRRGNLRAHLTNTWYATSSVMNYVEDAALEALLRWYVAMGVDAPVDEAPHDRFAAAEPLPPALRVRASLSPAGMPARADAAPASVDALVQQARHLAAAATDLADLEARWANLSGCSLPATASRMIFSGGTQDAPVMLIGGAPEADDERHGQAFAGPSGRLLDAMLQAIGLDRTNVYLANVIPWRPPGARPASPLELALCLPFARRHIALADPRVLVCLGERAAQPLLDSRESISRLRGRWLSYEGEVKTVKTLVMFSPAYLLKQPLQKRRAWADLRMLANELNEPRPAGPSAEVRNAQPVSTTLA